MIGYFSKVKIDCEYIVLTLYKIEKEKREKKVSNMYVIVNRVI